MKLICYLSISLLLFVSCIGHEKDYLGDDIELWKDTEAWDFAKCISKGKFEKAEKILEENHLDVDFREPKFGETLLSWAIFNDNIDAVKFLIDHGANPNLHNTYNGESPMTNAAGEFNSIEMLKYLLAHGGDPNDYVKEDEKLTGWRSPKTPLIAAAFISLEKTKMLIEAGADPNFSVEPGYTPLVSAERKLLPDVLEFLYFECQADYSKSFDISIVNEDTISFRDLIENRNIFRPEDSIIAKRIIDHMDGQIQQLARN